MATLDELQAQLEELIRRVNEITAPPDDYYTHRFSGEEIDNAVGRVKATPGSGAITAGNVGAAPSGYGLGEFPTLLNRSHDLNNLQEKSGWYYWAGDVPSNAPPDNDGQTPATYQTMLSCGWTQISFGASNNIVKIRKVASGIWAPWEWVNPPMTLGVEYRTVERYKGKPVYVKLVDCGALPNATYKTVGISGATQVLRVSGTANTGRGIPGFFGSAQDSFIGATPNGGSIMLHAFLDASNKTCECTAWYIKE